MVLHKYDGQKKKKTTKFAVHYCLWHIRNYASTEDLHMANFCCPRAAGQTALVSSALKQSLVPGYALLLLP